jgi:hypothetical protein
MQASDQHVSFSLQGLNNTKEALLCFIMLGIIVSIRH